MRRARWLILLAMLATAAAVVATYRLQKLAQDRGAPNRPPRLPRELGSRAEDWTWTQTEGQRRVARIRARRVGQAQDSSRIELEQVELHIFREEADEYDKVVSARAEFFPADRRLYSEGEVEITLGISQQGRPRRRPVSIRSSGVTYDSATGRASTERAASFVFENGAGRCVGAWYDPAAKELHMNTQAVLDWKTAAGKPMRLEGHEVIYKEAESKIWLLPWARLVRADGSVEAGPSVVNLQDGVIRLVETKQARGNQRSAKRLLRYSAEEAWIRYAPSGEVEKIEAHQNARLVSSGGGAESEVAADRVDLEFAAAGDESRLQRALALGKARVESRPAKAETRVLTSEVVELKMRPDGEEIDTVEAHAPGRIEFQPRTAGQRRRIVEGERMGMRYGERNQMQSFRAVEARTTTEPRLGVRGERPAITQSKVLTAEFHPQTGEMERIEQVQDFVYESGDRRARAAKAILHPQREWIELETEARVWDPSGSTSADRIQIDQGSGDFTAEGRVNSSREPEKQKSGSEMLAGEEPLQAIARKMRTANRNQRIDYEGDVTLWQGGNRVEADHVTIDREARTLTARRKVLTQFIEESKPGYTVVRAGHLVYTEGDRLAHYTGGAVLTRGGLHVKSAVLRAFLAEQGSDSRIEKAYADGGVEIQERSAERTRTGKAEHAEYYAGEQKILLKGGNPELADSRRGLARGAELTYYAGDDRLLINGAPGRPAVSRIKRK